METQEIILEESSATPSNQNEDIIQIETLVNVNDDISNDAINDSICKLYEQQEKNFEVFGNQFNLQLRNFFKETLINLDRNIIKVEMESINSNNSIDVEEVRKKFDEKLIFQSKMIEGLNTRIEKLETNSIIDNQDLEKFEQEFGIFKKESRTSLKITPTQNNVSLNTNREKENFISEGLARSSTSQQSDKLENKVNKPNERKVHGKICQFVNKHKNKPKKFKDNTFEYLSGSFTIQDLLEYEKSVLFHSLDDPIKKSVNSSISELLKKEMTCKKRLSQPINVYIDRKLVPSLPSDVKSYKEFQQTREFDLLSDKIKIGIRKLILIEEMM
jgi:hypothetical protein